MTIPSVKASTQNVDQGGDKISLARADIKQNIDNVNEIIDHLGEGNNQLLIPLTGFVVTETTVGYDSAGEWNANKFRMALLGGRYYLRSTAGMGALTGVQSPYGSIPGASVTTSTPTVTNPTGYSATGTNYNTSITGGTWTNSVFGISGNADTNDNWTGSKYIGYSTGYDNYVTLPAGDYKVKLLSNINSITDTYTINPGFEGDTSAFTNLNIWNRTDDTLITSTNVNIADWDKDTAAVFTLATAKDVQFFNPTSSVEFTENSDDLQFQIGSSTVITGDVFNSGSPGTMWIWNPRIPAKLGWVTLVPNVYIEITKIA